MKCSLISVQAKMRSPNHAHFAEIKTEWNMFCQKYCFTKILHITGKSRKWFSRPLSHRPQMLEKKEEWKPPNWQGHKSQTSGAWWAPRGRSCRGLLANTFQMQGGPAFQQISHEPDLQGQRWETHRTQKTTVSIFNKRVSNLKVTKIVKCSETLDRFLPPLGERQWLWHSFKMLRWSTTPHLTTVYIMKHQSPWVLSLEKQEFYFTAFSSSRHVSQSLRIKPLKEEDQKQCNDKMNIIWNITWL